MIMSKSIKVFFMIFVLIWGVFFFDNLSEKVHATSKLPLWFEEGESFQLFNDVLLAPGISTGIQSFKIKNVHKQPIDIFTSFNFALEKEGYSKEQLDRMIHSFEISGVLTYNNQLTNYHWMSLKEFEGNFNNIKFDHLDPNKAYEFQYNIRLNENADNSFQGMKLHGELTIKSDYSSIAVPIDKDKAGEKVIEVGGERLPITATNLANVIVFGIILLIVGVLTLLILFNRKNTRKIAI